MERNGFSDVTPSPKPHKKNIILQKHKVIVYLFVCLIDCFIPFCLRFHWLSQRQQTDRFGGEPMAYNGLRYSE